MPQKHNSGIRWSGYGYLKAAVVEKVITDIENEETNPEAEEVLPGIPKRISKEEINQLPLARFNGRVHIITTPEAARIATGRLKEVEVLGFDTESRPSFRKGENFSPSIVQFAAKIITI